MATLETDLSACFTYSSIFKSYDHEIVYFNPNQSLKQLALGRPVGRQRERAAGWLAGRLVRHDNAHILTPHLSRLATAA